MVFSNAGGRDMSRADKMGTLLEIGGQARSRGRANHHAAQAPKGLPTDLSGLKPGFSADQQASGRPFRSTLDFVPRLS